MSDSTSSYQRLARLGGVLVALLLIGAGWTLWQRDAGQGRVVDPGRVVDVAESATEPPPTPEIVPAVAGSPRRIVIPALSIDSQVDSIRTLDRTLVPPPDPQRIGWWADGARPGARRGTALLTGHTVNTGGGAFDDLEDLAADDRVEMYAKRGTITYRVISVQTLSLQEVAIRHRELFDQGGSARLVLVTCEDWDGQAYQSSVIVTAIPVVTAS